MWIPVAALGGCRKPGVAVVVFIAVAVAAVIPVAVAEAVSWSWPWPWPLPWPWPGRAPGSFCRGGSRGHAGCDNIVLACTSDSLVQNIVFSFFFKNL